MAALDFPDPSESQVYIAAGIKWTWNDTLKVWSSDAAQPFTEEQADARYLRVDAAAPEQNRLGAKTFFTNDVEIQGKFVVSKSGNSDGIISQLGDNTATSQTLRFERGHDANSNVDALRVYGGGLDAANIQAAINYAGGGTFSGVTVTGVKNAAFLGTNANGALIAKSDPTPDLSIYLRSNATDSYSNGKLSIDSQSSSGHYWGCGIGYNNSNWRHLNADSWGFAFRNSGGSLDIYTAKEAGTASSVATYRTLSIGGSSSNLTYDGNKVWHGGNDGSGSGLDADLLRGAAPATEATEDTIVKRTSSADIKCRFFRSTAASTSTISGAMAFRVNSGSDNYVRFCSSTPAIRDWLNIPKRDGGGASGTWSISISGNAASASEIYRNGINKGATAAYRVLLGPNSNNAGNAKAYVVTDESQFYYTPNTRRISGVSSISGKADNAGSADNAINCSRKVNAGNGLNGGGTLNADITINAHDATTSQKGVVKLSDSTSNTSTTLAATANAAKKAYDRAASYAPSKTGNGASGNWSITSSKANNLQVQNFSNSGTWKTIAGIGTGDSSYPKQGEYHSYSCQATNGNQLRMNGVGDVILPGTINGGWQFPANNKIKSGSSNSAMVLSSVNGKYNFRDSGDNNNTGQIQAGNVTFRSLNRIVGDEDEAANYSEDGDYTGPVEDLLATIDALKADNAAAKSMISDMQTRLLALEGA